MSAEAHVYRKATVVTLIAIGVLAVAGVIVGHLVDGSAGIMAALIGVGVAAVAGLTTQVSMLLGHRQRMEMMSALLLGGWLIKMLIIVAALLILQGVEDFNRELFAGFAVGGIIATLVIDVWVLLRSRVAYVEPGSKQRGE